MPHDTVSRIPPKLMRASVNPARDWGNGKRKADLKWGLSIYTVSYSLTIPEDIVSTSYKELQMCDSSVVIREYELSLN